MDLRANSPDGTLTLDYKGKVDCYHQNGNRAWFSGVITGEQKGTRADQARRFFHWAVLDGGEPAQGVDRIATSRSATPVDCTDESFEATMPLTGGNIQVHEPKK